MGIIWLTNTIILQVRHMFVLVWPPHPQILNLCFFFSSEGFESTAKQNFGGGNTAWEERKLSKYETRWDCAARSAQDTFNLQADVCCALSNIVLSSLLIYSVLVGLCLRSWSDCNGSVHLIITFGGSCSFAFIYFLPFLTKVLLPHPFSLSQGLVYSCAKPRPFHMFQHLVSSVRSEIRLMEIVEGLCESSSFECNRMVEEHEDHFETWWFKRWVVLDSGSLVDCIIKNFPNVWSIKKRQYMAF